MNCKCAICQNNLPFKIPDEIIDAAKRGDLVLFCGAGISTEKRSVLPYSFYTSIREELGLENTDISFSNLMQQYCQCLDFTFLKDHFDLFAGQTVAGHTRGGIG